MTAVLLDRSTRRPPAGRPNRRQPRLRVLDQAAARRRARHRSALLILFVSVLVGFFAVAFVHAELVAGQHDLDAVRARISEAEGRHAELARAVEEASAPDVIVTRAHELGMVRANDPVYLTAAAPLLDVQVQPALATRIASEGPVSEGVTTVAAVAATSDQTDRGTSPGTDRALRGSLGLAGGISAAVQVPDTVTLAIDAPADSAPTGGHSPVGVATSTPGAVPGATAAPDVVVEAPSSPPPASTGPAGITVVSASAPAAEPSSPSGAPGATIAGRTAVSGTAGAVASTSTNGLATAAAASGTG
jgi:cell division protein FtsL